MKQMHKITETDGKVILVVDDSIVMRSVLKTALVGKHFVVHTARDAADAISCLDRRDDIDLVLTDFHMPGMDGAGFIEKIRVHPRYGAVPVLVLTAGADAEEKQHARDAGASGWIVKPFDAGKLSAAIDTLVPEHLSSSKGAKPRPRDRDGNGRHAAPIVKANALQLRYDTSDGLIHTHVAGPTDREGIERYLYSLQTLVERARADWGRVWHLIDAHALQEQTAEALTCMAGVSIDNVSFEDRTAIVMTSPRAIKQIQAMPSQFMSEIFKDMQSAHNWLVRKNT